jgi:hypothetical protein
MPILINTGEGISVDGGIRTGEEDDDCCCLTYAFCTACPAPGLTATYSNSLTAGVGIFGPIYTGPTVLTVVPDAPIDKDFSGSPGTGVNEAFQVEWSGRIYAPVTGTYTFYMNVTNGAVGLLVNDTELIDEWTTPASGNYTSSTIALTAGRFYSISALYRREDANDGAVTLEWSHPSQTRQVIPAAMLVEGSSDSVTNGIEGQYFNDIALTDPSVLTRTDSNINFTWAASPGSGVNADNFSVRWEGTILVSQRTLGSVQPGEYSVVFSTDTTDGVRLWIDGELIIDDWNDHGSLTTNTASAVVLRAGFYSIKMEAYSKTGTAQVQLYRAIDGAARAIVPGSELYHSGTGAEKPPRMTTTFADVEMPTGGDTCCGGKKFVSGGLDGVSLCLRQVTACMYEYDSRYDGPSPIVIHRDEVDLATCAAADAVAEWYFLVQVQIAMSGATKLASVAVGYPNGNTSGILLFDYGARPPEGMCNEMTLDNSLTSRACIVGPWNVGINGTITISYGCEGEEA